MCPHTTMCPHTPMYVSSYQYICVLLPDSTSWKKSAGSVCMYRDICLLCERDTSSLRPHALVA